MNEMLPNVPIMKNAKIEITHLIFPRKVNIYIIIQLNRSFSRRIQDIHNRLLLTHDTVMVSMIRSVEIALTVGAVGSDEAFRVSKAGGRVAFGDGVDCACCHFARS